MTKEKRLKIGTVGGVAKELMERLAGLIGEEAAYAMPKPIQKYVDPNKRKPDLENVAKHILIKKGWPKDIEVVFDMFKGTTFEYSDKKNKKDKKIKYREHRLHLYIFMNGEFHKALSTHRLTFAIQCKEHEEIDERLDKWKEQLFMAAESAVNRKRKRKIPSHIISEFKAKLSSKNSTPE